MDQTYDTVVLGTGITECILSSLRSKDRVEEATKVLHMDQNDYYGAKITSFTPLSKLFEHFGKQLTEGQFGRERDWNVDLIPKFLMANGELVKLLVHTGVTRYLDFKHIECSYVWKRPTENTGGWMSKMQNLMTQGGCHKVPATTMEAGTTKLMGPIQKTYLKSFLTWIKDIKLDDNSTWKHKEQFWPIHSPACTMEKIYKYFGLDENSQDFIGHAIMLFRDDKYKYVNCLEAIKRTQLYYESLARFGTSPYLYPQYGLGELPQGFARLAAVFGGTYMLNKKVKEIAYGDDGKVCGVTCVKSDESGADVLDEEGNITYETVKCSNVICDPTYAPEKCRVTAKVIRVICLLRQAVAFNNTCPKSFQIIMPANQLNRRSDIYVNGLSAENSVTAGNYYLACVSGTQETPQCTPSQELKLGLDLLGAHNILATFEDTQEMYEPLPEEDGSKSNLFISKSYDPSADFESVCSDVKSLYKRVYGEEFDFSKVKGDAHNDEC